MLRMPNIASRLCSSSLRYLSHGNCAQCQKSLQLRSSCFIQNNRTFSNLIPYKYPFSSQFKSKTLKQFKYNNIWTSDNNKNSALWKLCIITRQDRLYNTPPKKSETEEIFDKNSLSESNTKETNKPDNIETTDVTTEEKKPGILERFKEAYKQYGKVLISVHVATSIVWYSAFFYAAKSGIDVVPMLKALGAGDTILKPFQQSGAGNFAVAYLLYKIATPARYTVTIAGTQLTVKQLQKLGYLEAPAAEDSIRNLMKDGRSHVKGRIGDMKDNVDDMADSFKDNIKDKMKEKRETMKDKSDSFKDNIKDKMKEQRETMKDKYDEIKTRKQRKS